MSEIPISPFVQIREQAALIEHYRNRNLLLSQALEEARTKTDELLANLKDVRAEVEQMANAVESPAAGDLPETVEEA
ncbi:hypothetical protein SAMN05892877_105351 [Rhizobium subbaraonis]|uniref:Uncharacterized protein n=1 Tax=Rhizobium subbaraonis TaxID=908946 RepID=A0A285UB53_9HYPH|nr:hypothetical protein [Rhizobium subbaraonis]SOC38963.1 hypothetical protein SAMN05892877_105351 [Rhizobium subbaraonis]